MNELLEIERIRQLKYRYFRLLDMKRFRELVTLFAEDATTAYDCGRYSYQGREAIFEFLNTSMGMKEAYTSHQGHHPEITLIDDTHATGIWHFEDTVHRTDYNVLITGAGIYWDEYIKRDGQWHFQHTGYERLWVKQEKLPVDPSRSLRGLFDEEEIERSRQRSKLCGELALFPHR